MKITFDKSRQIFHLQTQNVSYVMKVAFDRYLLHLYWGKRIEDATALDYLMEQTDERLGFLPVAPKTENFCLGMAPQEVPVYGSGDYRGPLWNADWKTARKF